MDSVRELPILCIWNIWKRELRVLGALKRNRRGVFFPMTDESPRRHIPPEERAPWREFYYDPVVLGKFLLLYFFKSTILNYSSTIYYFTFIRSRIEVFLNLKSIEGSEFRGMNGEKSSIVPIEFNSNY